MPIGSGTAHARTFVQLGFDCVERTIYYRVMHHPGRDRTVVIPDIRELDYRVTKDLREAAGVSRTAYIAAWRKKPKTVRCP
jgi:hypothetical protein